MKVLMNLKKKKRSWSKANLTEIRDRKTQRIQTAEKSSVHRDVSIFVDECNFQV